MKPTCWTRAVLDFLLAQNTPPVALWTCRLRFFTACGIHPHYIRVSVLRRISLYAGGRRSRSPAPPWAFTTKNVGKAEPKKWVNIPKGRKGALAPLHKIILAKQMIVGETQKNTPSFAPTSVLYNGLRAFNKLTSFPNVDWLLVVYWHWSPINAFNIFCLFHTKILIIYFKSSGRGYFLWKK